LTIPLYLKDSYLKSFSGEVIEIDDDKSIVLNQSIFYPTSGGQPGDTGVLLCGDNRCEIISTRKGENGKIILVPANHEYVPKLGDNVEQVINWETRYKHMRVHSALHLLSVVIPLPVTGGSITDEKGRLDFNMPDALSNKEELESHLNELIVGQYKITQSWITDEELLAQPGLVKTMSVQPPIGSGQVRLVRIGSDDNQIDLQPCGGTHVANTSEIGSMRFGKIEKKGKQNRRVNIHFTD
jgi:misacylated tRNA(Ala) deacylase